MRNHIFINDSYYHVYNRGVDKRDIFNNKNDVDRFLLCMQLFQYEKPIGSIQHFLRNKDNLVDVGHLQDKDNKKIVSIVEYCLNPNHFHFILKQEKEGGISEFMKRLEGGYTKYFNIKYTRSGSLFQGRFKSSYAEKENYFDLLFFYVMWNYKIHDIPKNKLGIIKTSEEEYKNSNFIIVDEKEGYKFLEWFHGYEEFFKKGMEMVSIIRKGRGKDLFPEKTKGVLCFNLDDI